MKNQAALDLHPSGREFLNLLRESEKFPSVTVLMRNYGEIWDALDEEGKVLCSHLWGNFLVRCLEEAFNLLKGKVKTKVVVYEEHTLGYVHPRTPYSLSVLKVSVLNGGNPSWNFGQIPLPLNYEGVRLANRNDFDAFGVESRGYFTGEYETA
jgi:hypothetical protein